MKLYNSMNIQAPQSGFFFVELIIACFLLILIATIVAQCQVTLHTIYHAAITRIDRTTNTIYIAEQFIQTLGLLDSHDLIKIEKIPVSYSYFPGKPIKGTLVFIKKTEDTKEFEAEYQLITGIFDNE